MAHVLLSFIKTLVHYEVLKINCLSDLTIVTFTLTKVFIQKGQFL